MWRKLHNEELHNLSSSPDSVMMQYARRLAHIKEVKYVYKFWSVNPKGRGHF